MNDRRPQPPPAAPKPRSNPNAGPVQIHFASFQRDFTGRPTAIFAGHQEVAEGTPVITTDPQFRSGCAFEGGEAARQALQEALERFLQSGGRKKFDELAAQLRSTYFDVAVERQLYKGYRAKAKELADTYASAAEVLKWEDAAVESQAKAKELERQIPIVQRQLAQERDLAQKVLQGHLQAALVAFQNEHFGKAAQLEAESLAAFLPAYAKALRERLIAKAADRELLTEISAVVALDEPTRPDAEQPPAQPCIYTTFAQPIG